MVRKFLVLAVLLTSSAWAQQNAPSPATSPTATKDSSGEANDRPSGSDQSDSESSPDPSSAPGGTSKPGAKITPPRSDRVSVSDIPATPGQSSSKDTQVDLSAPDNDAKAHPQSSTAVANAEAEALSGGVTEFRTWDPHKASKDVEVGDFYFKRKNYRAAEERYRDALRYKDNDAIATIRLAVCLEKLGILDDARVEYESYLKILPHGPQAGEAQRALDRLKAQTVAAKPGH
ncbi:MAG TPA: hypothetical protein VND65_22835 [Candidatus Binatia bacterium]|nr:hypothetical protein [Candidatus Binatia bacterium]